MSDDRGTEEDASRRTYFAAERTYLAWWRTGLTCVAVAIAVGGLLPDLTDSTRWPWLALGVGFAVIGVAIFALAVTREREMRRALAEGRGVSMSTRTTLLLGVAGGLLAVCTIVLILAE